ncbi:MAG: Ldh family oxidoreductase [Formivibrio sp.]|nr:Ldh family oxidoreductase [Formivibrio sp.]
MQENASTSYAVDDLTRFAKAMFCATDMEDDKADSLARLMVLTDMMGHRTHGLALLPPYLDQIEKGLMRKTGTYEIIKDKGSTAVWDGDYLPGHWLMEQALTESFKRVGQYGVVSIALRRCHHIGCLAAIVKQAADRGLIAMLFNSDPVGKFVAPYGGTEPLFTPDPFAIGYPTAKSPVLVDISSSITTVSMTRTHYAEGRQFKNPWLLDGDGKPTTDPAVLEHTDPRGSIQLVGGQEYGHKGFGLVLMNEALSQGLSGHGRKDNVTRWGGNVFLQVIDPEWFAGLDEFVANTDFLAEQCRHSRPADPQKPVRLPGDQAAKSIESAKRDGVAYGESTWASLVPWAEKLGVPVPKII